MYSLLRNLLFRLPPELAHDLSMDAIGVAERSKISSLILPSIKMKPVEVMGIQFPNPVGLAAGLDKNGDYYNGLGKLGFGFIEIGTVTPKSQPGNPRPRMFRLEEAEAIVNRMGFNNKGVDHLVRKARCRRYPGVLGINIGKNAKTSEEEAVQDYLYCLERVYPHADYIAINISSPNTPGLRNLQFGHQLQSLLGAISQCREMLAQQHGKPVPVAVKIAPDMDDSEIRLLVDNVQESGMDAIIATNTTVERDAVRGLKYSNEAGGLSGAPLTEKSNQVIETVCSELRGALPVIGVGGIMTAEDALAKLRSGASLVQVYTGFIYKGPGLLNDILKAL